MMVCPSRRTMEGQNLLIMCQSFFMRKWVGTTLIYYDKTIVQKVDEFRDHKILLCLLRSRRHKGVGLVFYYGGLMLSVLKQGVYAF